MWYWLLWHRKKIGTIVMSALVVAACATLFERVAFAANVVVTDVRVSERSAKTRVVFEFTHDLKAKIFMLSNPNRVVIDMPEVGWQLPPRPLPSSVGVFKTLRYGLFEPGKSRVVVDLRSPAVVKKAFLMEPSGARQYRLVIDLASATKSAFMRQVKSSPIQVVSTIRGGFAKTLVPTQTTQRIQSPEIIAVSKPQVISRSSIARPKLVNAKEKRNNKVAVKPEFIDKDLQKLISTFRPAPRKPANRPSNEMITIIIDSGHGGADPGTIGRSGVYEKHITLAMARELAKQLKAQGRFNVVMTRNRDIFIPLRKRVKMARDADADLFISLHADAVKNHKISGPSVYTLSERASDKEAAALAEKENKSDLIAGMDLSHESEEVANILIDLAQRESMNQSARFATQLVSDLKRKTRLLRNTHRFAGFAVLKAPDIPSVLIEMGFLSNRNDERKLQTRDYRKKFASGIVAAINTYFSRVEEASRN